MTLKEKIASLQETVAYPTSEDYAFLVEDDSLKEILTNKMNSVLEEALLKAKSRNRTTWGDIRESIVVSMRNLASQYPNSGILDSEVFQSIAIFFAVNLDPSMYDYMRYGMIILDETISYKETS